MSGLPIARASGGWGVVPQAPFVELPCLTAGHDPRASAGTAPVTAGVAGEGAAAWTSTTHRHGPLPTVSSVIPGLTRGPASSRASRT